MISYLGIDPGLSGGFVVISGKAINLKFAMPTITITKNGLSKKEIDREGVFSFLLNLPRPLTCCIEEQHAFRQNLSTSCTLCKNYGILLGILCVSGITPIEISSSVWQKHFGIVSVKKAGGKTTKGQAFDILIMLYPSEIFGVSAEKPKYHDGIGDAALIAKYCQSLFAPTPDEIEPLEVKPIQDVTRTIKPLECKPGGSQSGTKLERSLF